MCRALCNPRFHITLRPHATIQRKSAPTNAPAHHISASTGTGTHNHGNAPDKFRPLTMSPTPLASANSLPIHASASSTNNTHLFQCAPSSRTILIQAPTTAAPHPPIANSTSGAVHALNPPPCRNVEYNSILPKNAPVAHAATPPTHTNTVAISNATANTGRVTCLTCLRRGTPRATTYSHAAPPTLPTHRTTCCPTTSHHSPRTFASSLPHRGQI